MRLNSKSLLHIPLPSALIYLLYVVSFLISTLVSAAEADKNETSSGVDIKITDGKQIPTSLQEQCNIKLNNITGNIYSLQHDDITTTRMSLMDTKILVNYGQYIGYPKDDGSFEVDNLPSDSYVVEITHPRFLYEPARVDITSKGKIRARRVNYIQPSLVQTIDYPLRFRPKTLHNYFIPRETWRVMDLLFNPMVIMMVVPLVIIWVLPKMMSPQEAQAQVNSAPVPEYNVPELSEMMANMFGQGGQAAAGQGASSSGGGSQAITSGSGGTKHSKKRGR